MRQLTTLLITCIALSAACNDTPTQSDNETADLTADVAAVAAVDAAADVQAMASLSGVGTAPLFLGPPIHPGNVENCTFDGTSWTCPKTRDNGLDVTRVVTFRDAGGAAEEQFDGALTASIGIVADITGELTTDRWSGSVARHRELLFSGLEGTETTRTVNGAGTGTASRVRMSEGGETRSYNMTSSFTLVDIVLPVGPGSHWPISGTASRTYTVTRGNGTTTTRIVVITFDGTNTPAATVNGEPFEIDLAARHARRRP